jgi:SAM-dependent methyltransferase
MHDRSSMTSPCSFCQGRRLKLVLDLGDVALAGGFVREEQFASEQTYPLRLFFCEDCFALQVADKIAPEILFEKYYYFSSSIGTLRNHFAEYASELATRFGPPSSRSVLEFGCNDGVFLRPLADQGFKTVVGVDPAVNVVFTIKDSRLHLVNSYFTQQVARDVTGRYGKFDLILASNVYAHIPDIAEVTRAVATALAPEGVFAFEVHYLGKLLAELQYDMIYHEHLYYYSLLAVMNHLRRHGMMVFDIKPIPIHGGSMRFYACHQGSKYSRAISAALAKLEAEERARGLDRFETYQRFADAIANHRRKLIDVLQGLRQRGKKLAGYGASGRANTIIQYCGIGHDLLEFMIDDAPAKIGLYTPRSHFKIYPSSVLYENDPPDYVLLFAWSFMEEVRARHPKYFESGGRMIIPLPEITILPQPG